MGDGRARRWLPSRLNTTLQVVWVGRPQPSPQRMPGGAGRRDRPTQTRSRRHAANPRNGTEPDDR